MGGAIFAHRFGIYTKVFDRSDALNTQDPTHENLVWNLSYGYEQLVKGEMTTV
jgi:hypothetical protein